MSFNYHRDHFGTTWDIVDAAGEPAHTGCVAFGMDRLAVAMFHTHGIDLDHWPVALRELLRPSITAWLLNGAAHAKTSIP